MKVVVKVLVAVCFISAQYAEKTNKRTNSKRVLEPIPYFPTSTVNASSQAKWNKYQLTYKILNFTETLNEFTVKSFFENAIREWLANVNLRIKETSSNPDIKIMFIAGDDFIGYTKDCPSHFLASYKGCEISINMNQNYTIIYREADRKIYFGWVVAHLLGHALGLIHSNDASSVMYNFYLYQPMHPTASDTAELRKLYGPAKMEKSALCKGTTIDAIIDLQELLLVKGNQFWILSNFTIQNGPFPLNMIFGEIYKIDAAFVVKKRVLLLVGNVSHVFKINKSGIYENEANKAISSSLLIPPNIDAAFHDPQKKMAYFFKDSKYYVISTVNRTHLLENGSDISSNWNGIPNNIEAATILNNREQVLFIKDGICYISNLNSKYLQFKKKCSNFMYKCPTF